MIGEIVALNLGLRRVAPTVAVGRDPAAVVLAALRGAGYAPAADPAEGQKGTAVAVRRAPESQLALVTVVTADGTVEVVDPDVGHVALIDRLRGANGGVSFTRLTDDAVRLLAEAAERGTAVWIEYESVFSTSGKTSWLLLDELDIESRQVVAWCHTRQKEESFPLYSIRSVELA